MKKILVAGALAMLASSPAPAQSFLVPANALKNAVGQPLYDVHDTNVGVIRGVTNETGQASAIVSIPHGGPGNYEVLIIALELQPRNGGGWLSSLPAGSIFDMPPYIPGHMLPLSGP